MIQTKVASTFEGKPCHVGHTERYITTKACVACNKENSRLAHKARMAAKKEPTKEELGFAATVKKVYKRSAKW